jgi:hypothetical protein
MIEERYSADLRSVLFNLAVAAVLAVLGIVFFAFIWLRDDMYAIPDQTQENWTDSNGIKTNRVFQYFRGLFGVVERTNISKFTDRYGFEYYFYLQFHRSIALMFLLSFGVIALVTGLYSLTMEGSLRFALERIVGIYSEGNKSSAGLNTVIMAAVSLTVTIYLHSLLRHFHHELDKKQAETLVSPGNELNWIINTALLRGAQPDDVDHRMLRSHLDKKIKENNLHVTIVDLYPLPDYVALSNVIDAIDTTKIYYNNSCLAKSIARLL